jgi:hypothetical protein
LRTHKARREAAVRCRDAGCGRVVRLGVRDGCGVRVSWLPSNSSVNTHSLDFCTIMSCLCLRSESTRLSFKLGFLSRLVNCGVTTAPVDQRDIQQPKQPPTWSMQMRRHFLCDPPTPAMQFIHSFDDTVDDSSSTMAITAAMSSGLPPCQFSPG